MRLPEPAGGLTLRRWCAADEAALVAIAGDPLLLRWTGMRVATPEQARQWLAGQADGWRAGVRFSFAVDDAGGALAGNVALKRPDPAGTTAEVGYWTAPAARGRGVASQAAGVLTGWAFATFPEVRELLLLHQVDNVASCRVAQRCGYAYRLTLPAAEPYPLEGHVHGRDRPVP